MVSLIVRDLISGASFGRHILDEWQIKGVGGVQCSAPLEPSPGESRRLLDDRECLELSPYRVSIAKGIVLLYISLHCHLHSSSCTLCCTCCRPLRGRSTTAVMIHEVRELIEYSIPTPKLVEGHIGKFFTHTYVWWWWCSLKRYSHRCS